MRGQDLLREIEYIDNDLIEEARVIKKQKRNYAKIIGSIGSLAAIFAISLIAYHMLDTSGLIKRKIETTETASVATATTATVEESVEEKAEEGTRFGEAQLETMDTATAESVKEDLTEAKEVTDDSISDEQAVLAIRNYCCTANPDLESTAAEGYPVYWDIDSSDENEVVVLFRSYTGAMIRYYIDRVTGNTNVTEFVLGIMDEEEPTGENFNVRDYIQ